MIGQVVYKNGYTEPIVWFSQSPDICEVCTPSGRYAYQEWIEQHPKVGYKYRAHAFWTYVGWPDKWELNYDIKEFRFMEETTDEYREADDRRNV